MNSTPQADRELEVFGRFISIARLPVDPDSVQKCDPPAPDILCHHETNGPVAFELAELINQEFADRLGRQHTTQNVLETVHGHLPAADKNAFDRQYRNAVLAFKFRPGTGKQKVRGNVSDVFGELSAFPKEFEGDVNEFTSKTVSKIVESVSISRGGFNGPILSVESIGGLGNSVVRTIQNKLTKTYESDYPIELLGYLDVAGMFPPQLWKGPANAFLENLSDLGPFRRIWVVDIRNESVEIVRPAA